MAICGYIIMINIAIKLDSLEKIIYETNEKYNSLRKKVEHETLNYLSKPLTLNQQVLASWVNVFYVLQSTSIE